MLYSFVGKKRDIRFTTIAVIFDGKRNSWKLIIENLYHKEAKLSENKA